MWRAKRSALTIISVGLLWGLAQHARSQTESRPNSAPSAHCSTPEYRQLDFWIGDWEVYDDKGKLQGYNLVEKVLGGCALQEYYIDVGGLKATSFSMYDFTRKLWNQTYISSAGTLLPIEGYLQGKNMVLTGTHFSHDDGRLALHRMIWTPKEDGTAYQIWDFSRDGGKTWTVIYEGFLRKATKPFPREQFK